MSTGRIGMIGAFAVVLGSAHADAQDVPTSPIDRRLEFPFAVDVDRLPGPPRAMGELPPGQSQMPSTLPGFLSGPPRAQGFAPERPPLQPPFGAGVTLPGRIPGGATTLPSLAPPGTNVVLPSGSFFVPGLLRQPEAGELPPALAEEVGLGRSSGEPGLGDRRNSGVPPLVLDELLARAERSYPPFLAVLQERDAALGDLISQQGSFDINLNSDSRNYPLGYYRRSVHDVFLEFPLQNLGGKFFSGYRYAEGKWPTYYNYLNTLSGGGFINGLELPLLKNRAIDPKRAKLYQAEIERRKVEPTILKQRISLYKDASKTYWGWVAAGQQLFLYDNLVKAVELRQRGLEELVRRQALRAVDLVDFERILLSRQMQQIGARRRFQQAAIELSLYARDDLGMPAMPPEDRLPYEFPPAVAPDPDKVPEDFEVALRLRPEIQSLRLLAKKAQIDLGLAENQLLPSLNLYIYTEQDVGNQPISLGPDSRPFIMESSLLFDVPLQRRYAKGRVIAANAEIRQINMQAQYACDRVKADVLDARSALQAAHDQLARTRDYLGRSRDLLKAEVVAVREGVGTVLTYNLREQAVYDALVSEVDAEYKFHAAAAEYRAALGLDAASNLPEPPPSTPTTAPETWSTRPRPGRPATPSTSPGR